MTGKWLLAPVLAAVLALAAANGDARAGTACGETAPTPDTIATAGRAAQRTLVALQRTASDTVVIARVGADISRYGLRYTHAGIALRAPASGRWFVRHQLNHCGSDRSGLYDQGLLNFFLDDLHDFDALLLVPRPGLRRRLRAVAMSNAVFLMYQPAYSVIANPFATRYQNSNQWLLELLALAEAPPHSIGTRADAHRFLRNHGYRPSRVRISAWQRLGASLFRANVRFDDHSAEAQARGEYPVASVRSLESYLLRRDAVGQRIVVRNP